MAKASGLSQSTVSRMWRAFGLKPHLVQTWKLSTDPQFVDKVREVVGLYLDPPEKAIVLCVDEKSQIQAIDRTDPGGHADHTGTDDPRLCPPRHCSPRWTRPAARSSPTTTGGTATRSSSASSNSSTPPYRPGTTCT